MPIEREEWDFSSLFTPASENQLILCHAYERFREIKLQKILDYLRHDWSDYQKIWPEWPDTPFLKIPIRRRVSVWNGNEPGWDDVFPKDLDGLDFDKQILPQVVCANTTWMGGRLIGKDGTETLPLAINWKRSDSELVEQFRRLIKRIRPVDIRPRKPEKGRGSWIRKMQAELKALGALRVLREARKHSGPVYAKAELWTTGKNGEPLYNTRKSWLAAEKRALDFINIVG